jgi:tetratricopeptide (TPR) repeat protein
MSKPAAPADLLAKIRSAHQVIKKQSLYERLGVPHNASNQTIRRAYNDAAAEWHPDRHNKWDLGSDGATLTHLFAMLTEAQSVLTNKQRRGDYNAELAMTGQGTAGRRRRRLDAAALFAADSAFRLGQQLLDAGKIRPANQRFNEAFEQNPESIEYRVYSAYTEYLLLPRTSKGKPKNNTAVAAAREEFTNAVETLPDFDAGHVMLGRTFLDTGDLRDAKRCFNKALLVNARNVQAKRQLRLLNMRGGEDGGDFLDKLKALLNKKL